MKKIIFGILTLVIVVSCKQEKIAYIDNSYVINEYQEKKDIESKYKSKIEAYNKKRDSIGKALQLDYQAFQLKSQSMTESDAQSEYNALMQKQQMLQQQFQMEEQQISKDSQTEIDSLISKVKTFVKKHGKENNYTYILGTSEAASGVMYGKEENNISETILKALNESYKKD
ncbi:OmpH family outer membrane protein [Hanstruepera ponticola]|uniref:OmpH family outer membrane protein n=1 Tax=Hanstruepera ponticola TaxID=2042995 RepID=UPI000CF1BAF4|nr:OmpH family outer membrane protein [Hanstruepera ponticola]